MMPSSDPRMDDTFISREQVARSGRLQSWQGDRCPAIPCTSPIPTLSAASSTPGPAVSSVQSLLL